MLNFEIDENKWNGKKEISIQVGKDFWISSPLSDFIDNEFSEVQTALAGMLSSKKETYDSIYNKIQEIKIGVSSHVCRGENSFKLKLEKKH